MYRVIANINTLDHTLIKRGEDPFALLDKVRRGEVDINGKTNEGYPFLIVALILNKEDQFKWLLSQGANMDCFCPKGLKLGSHLYIFLKKNKPQELLNYPEIITPQDILNVELAHLKIIFDLDFNFGLNFYKILYFSDYFESFLMKAFDGFLDSLESQSEKVKLEIVKNQFLNSVWLNSLKKNQGYLENYFKSNQMIRVRCNIKNHYFEAIIKSVSNDTFELTFIDRGFSFFQTEKHCKTEKYFRHQSFLCNNLKTTINHLVSWNSMDVKGINLFLRENKTHFKYIEPEEAPLNYIIKMKKMKGPYCLHLNSKTLLRFLFHDAFEWSRAEAIYKNFSNYFRRAALQDYGITDQILCENFTNRYSSLFNCSGDLENIKQFQKKIIEKLGCMNNQL